jgi:Family of unknown function (DUF5691)
MSQWRDLVTASLIGTERAVVPPATVPGLPPAEDDTSDPAAVLLDRAALLTAARRAGRPPDRAQPLPACEPDPRPAVSPAAARRLARMLGGQNPDLLDEWLTAAAVRRLRPPPRLLPALLDRARRVAAADSRLPRLVAEQGGPLARWLAGLNPDWDFVPAQALTGDDAWRLGDAGQRRGYLISLLASDPDRARNLVADGWEAAGPGERTMFLSVLADGLGPADEPLLEAALDDRAEDVHGWAAYLLARLPGSALGQRMAERSRRCLRLEHDARGPRLVIIPPAERDASMRRDGITPAPPPGRAPLAGPARLLLEIVARTPLHIWTEEFGLAAAQIVTVPAGHWTPVLFTGWSRAAIAQRNQDWAAALINRALTGRVPPASPSPVSAAETEALRQLARRADPALGAAGALAEPGTDAPPAVRGVVTVLRFRYNMLRELDDDHSGS